jgi:hypothetical protein
MLLHRTNMIRRSGGAALGIGGAFTFAISATNIWAMLRILGPAIETYQGSTALANIALGLVFAFLSAAAVDCGVRLVRNRPCKTWRLLVAVLPQVASVVVSGFQYRFSPAGFLGLAAYSVGPEYRVGILIQSGTQVILGFEGLDEWCVQLNVVAILVGALVFSDRLKRWFADDSVESPPGTA